MSMTLAAVDIGPQITAAFADLSTMLSTIIIPALFGLVVLGVVVALAIKYVKRGASKA